VERDKQLMTSMGGPTPDFWVREERHNNTSPSHSKKLKTNTP